MAFIETYDPNAPTDLDQARFGDDAIRELKRALTERLSQVIIGWPDTDPLKLNATAIEGVIAALTSVIPTGTLAARPNPPVAAGQAFWAYDTNQLFISIASGGAFIWDDQVGGSSEGGVTAPTNSAHIKKASYDANAGAGSRVSFYADCPKVLTIWLVGTTDAAGRIFIDLDEFSVAGMEVASYYQAAFLVGFSAFQEIDALPLLLHTFLGARDTVDNRIYVDFRKIDHSIHGTGAVDCMVTLYFSA